MIKRTLAVGAIALFTLTSTVFAASAAGPVSTANPAAAPAAVLAIPGSISPDETAGLQYMREEEKLAHDVYVTLADAWSLRVFDNIAASEQQHTNAIGYWLDYYNVDDPAAGNALGEFTDPALQALYDKLVQQGKQSVVEALKVGAAIEEIDIIDLEERMEDTTNVALDQLYGNLKAGSENHLRAFVTNLSRNGVSYAPQYLSQSAYNQIVTITSQGARNGRFGRRP